jgi:N6-adenosine-specific RNA methylase IME4
MFEELRGRKYNIIYADPPWTYRDKALAGERGAGCKYNLMTLEEIQSMPIDQIAADDCALFLWGTWPLLGEALYTVGHWGFTYKTLGFIWIKTNPKSGTPFWGMGNWSRSNSEYCLLATRGRPRRVSASIHSVVHAAIRRHSQKPDEVRDRIVQLCGDLPRVELFARERVAGWDSWGDGLPVML